VRLILLLSRPAVLIAKTLIIQPSSINWQCADTLLLSFDLRRLPGGPTAAFGAIGTKDEMRVEFTFIPVNAQ
jgi:hypothetical protein